ncbi:hypothetical protein [Haloarcula sp. JP-L23]|uniref:hypothetical protein n=1 Tax=Haloarcula sp. JP-L23 TaxID=2716717 RepID=UPI00140F3B23|nr:hypothetical protein G9465_08865 [Haloarcula sp. JP-L23]
MAGESVDVATVDTATLSQVAVGTVALYTLVKDVVYIAGRLVMFLYGALPQPQIRRSDSQKRR